MKKFNALLFAMALVAVVAFASVASAATTQFLAIDSSNGKVVVVNVDPNAEKKITYEGKTVVGAPVFNDLDNSYVKLFGYDGGVLAISSDKGGKGAKAYTFTVNSSGEYEYGKTFKVGAFSGDIRGVTTFHGNPVILATGAIGVLSDDKFTAFPVSVDAAFEYQSRLYVISGDAPVKLFEFSSLSIADQANTVYNLQLDTDKGVISKDISITTPATLKGDTSTVTIGNTVYIATGENGSFDKLVIPGAADSFMGSTTLSVKPFETVGNSKCFALTEKDGTLYALEKQSNNDLYLIIVSETDSQITKTSVIEKLSADIKGPADGTGSFDVYVRDDVIGVVNHGHALAIFTPDGNEWKFVESIDFASAAIAKTASTTPDTPVTPTTTVVDASTLAKASQDNLVAATPASAIADFVTAEEASTTTVPTGAQAAIEAELKKDDKTTVTLAAKTNYTPDKDGYILVKEAVDVSKVTVYFVEAATTTTTAATGDATKATLLDADCKEMGSTGTSVYAASGELKSGKTYTLVEATVSSTSGGDDEGEGGSTTSSSSGGCDAGFAAVSALLALAFVKKSR